MLNHLSFQQFINECAEKLSCDECYSLSTMNSFKAYYISLDETLSSYEYVNLLKYLSKFVDRKILDMCYKLYVRPHLDYGDVIYHNQRIDLMNLIEQVQYKAGLIVSGCWQGTNPERLYDELSWESMSNRRWVRRLTLFYKISNGHTPSYLADQITERSEMNIHFHSPTL